jgi:hypothetical protein
MDPLYKFNKYNLKLNKANDQNKKLFYLRKMKHYGKNTQKGGAFMTAINGLIATTKAELATLNAARASLT